MELLATHGEAVLFYLFATLAVGAALLVVTQRNPMYGAIALLLSFLAVAGLFFLRHAELVGAIQVFVYGGGIMVLFLFVIMLVNLHRLPEGPRFLAQSPLALVVAVVLVGLLVFVLLGTVWSGGAGPTTELVSIDGKVVGNTQAVGWSLYRQFLLPFEVASVFLLVAMIGAVVLGRRG